MSRFLPLVALALFPVACSQQPAATDSTAEAPTEYDRISTEIMMVETIEIDATKTELPEAKFPNAVIYVEAPHIKGTTQFGGASMQTAQFGSGDYFYAVHLEYLGHGEKGDRYGYSIYAPFPESDIVNPAFKEEQFAGEVEFEGVELILAKDEEAKAIYKILPEAPANL